MKLNKLIFPAPSCTYTAEDLEDELVWIPIYKSKKLKANRPKVS